MTQSFFSLRFWRFYFPPLMWAIVLFIASSIPDLKTPDLNIRFEDKWTHLIAYGLLGLLIARGLWHQSRWPAGRRHYLLLAFAFGTLYGISDEFHQAFVPGRFSDIYDVLADSAGSLLGSLLYGCLVRKVWPEDQPFSLPFFNRSQS